MIPVAIGSFVLLLVVAYLIAAPFLAQVDAGEADAVQLTEDRDRVLSQIRDLDMEFETGKLSEQEYLALRARRLAEVEATERALAEAEAEVEAARAEEEALDEVGDVEELADVTTNGHAPAPVTDDDLERAIAARKRSIEAQGCPECGAAIDTDDAFCRRCGADLAATQHR
jgi:ribosomal protein L40E